MLTARGRRTIAVALARGWPVGSSALPGLFGLAAAAVLVTWWRSSRFVSRTRPSPARPGGSAVVCAGEQAQLELTSRSREQSGRSRARSSCFADDDSDASVSRPTGENRRGDPGAAVIAPGRLRASHRERRGLIYAGAYTVTITDPLGLASRCLSSCPPARCVVLPASSPSQPSSLPVSSSSGPSRRRLRPSDFARGARRFADTNKATTSGGSTGRPRRASANSWSVREATETSRAESMTVLLDVGGPDYRTDRARPGRRGRGQRPLVATEDPSVGTYAVYRLVTTSGLDSGPVRGAGWPPIRARVPGRPQTGAGPGGRQILRCSRPAGGRGTRRGAHCRGRLWVVRSLMRPCWTRSPLATPPSSWSS